jgi:hypothetical protein
MDVVVLAPPPPRRVDDSPPGYHYRGEVPKIVMNQDGVTFRPSSLAYKFTAPSTDPGLSERSVISKVKYVHLYVSREDSVESNKVVPILECCVCHTPIRCHYTATNHLDVANFMVHIKAKHISELTPLDQEKYKEAASASAGGTVALSGKAKAAAAQIAFFKSPSDWSRMNHHRIE